jgi:hypothetical protein
VSEIDDIRRQMAQIRHDLHQDVSSVVGGVSEVVTEVSEVMDWRSVLRSHPYLLTGAAMAVGYLIVPRRARVVTQESPNRFIAPPAPEPPAPREQRARPLSWAINLLWPIAKQAVQSYAMIWIENQLKENLQQMGPDRDPQGRDPQGRDLPYRMPGQFR